MFRTLGANPFGLIYDRAGLQKNLSHLLASDASPSLITTFYIKVTSLDKLHPRRTVVWKSANEFGLERSR